MRLKITGMILGMMIGVIKDMMTGIMEKMMFMMVGMMIGMIVILKTFETRRGAMMGGIETASQRVEAIGVIGMRAEAVGVILGMRIDLIEQVEMMGRGGLGV